MKVKCSLCNEDLDTDTMTTLAKVIGWVDFKSGKYSGNVRLPSSALGFAHRYCVESPKYINQDSLF